MGVFKKFIGGIAIESVQAVDLNEPSGAMTFLTLPYKDENGSQHDRISTAWNSSSSSWSKTYRNFVPYGNMVPTASARSFDNHDVYDYEIENVVNVNYSTFVRMTGQKADRIFTIDMGNNKETEKTVRCIKFYKEISWGTTNGTTGKVLVCGFYLDNPIVLAPGESTVITLRMEIRANQ